MVGEVLPTVIVTVRSMVVVCVSGDGSKGVAKVSLTLTVFVINL